MLDYGEVVWFLYGFDLFVVKWWKDVDLLPSIWYWWCFRISEFYWNLWIRGATELISSYGLILIYWNVAVLCIVLYRKRGVGGRCVGLCCALQDDVRGCVLLCIDIRCVTNKDPVIRVKCACYSRFFLSVLHMQKRLWMLIYELGMGDGSGGERMLG